MQKITFVISSLGSGGAERVVSTLANELTGRGYEISILLVANRNQNYALSEKIKLHFLDCEKDLDQNVLKRYRIRLGKLRKALKAIGPDAVISFMSETNIDVCLAALGLKMPIVVSERNDPAIDPDSRAKRLLRRLAYRRADGFVFQTPDAQAYFSKKIQERSRIILNPLTGTIPQPYQGRREKRIAAVGRLNKQKNYPLLLEAFREFSQKHGDYVLEIYGKGPLEQQVRDQIKHFALEDRVVLKGFCANVHEAIREAAFFVMSSDFEGMPNALIEAMSLGLPCISTDCPCGGPRMLIEDRENGLLVGVGHKDSLVNAMCTLAEEPVLAEKLGENAQKLRKRVDVGTITNQWLEWIGVCAGTDKERGK